MAKKKLSLNQQLWQKELRRIERFQKSAIKRGFYFPQDIVPEQPKRITKQALKRLTDLTPEKQYAKAVYFDSETGKMIPGLEGRKKERSNASKKGWKKRKFTPRPRPIPEDPEDGPIADLMSFSRIIAMDRAIENMKFASEKIEDSVELEHKIIKSTWNSTKARFIDYKEILEEYLEQHDLEFQYSLDTIQYDSNSERVRQAMNRFIELLNYNEPLPTETLKAIEDEYTEIEILDANGEE